MKTPNPYAGQPPRRRRNGPDALSRALRWLAPDPLLPGASSCLGCRRLFLRDIEGTCMACAIGGLAANIRAMFARFTPAP